MPFALRLLWLAHGVLAAVLPRFQKNWWSLGPFASGKAEYDGDPLVPLGGVHRLFERKDEEVQEFLAEHAAGGRIAWREAAASSGGRKAEVQLPFDHINFQGLMQHPPTGGSSDVLHVQYWTVGHLKVKEPGVYGINCRNLHTFELQAPNGSVLGPLLGNIYSDPLVSAVVELNVGTYRLASRLRGKVPLRFTCVVEAREALSARVKSSNLPDLVRGRLLADPAPLDLRVLSGTSEWRRVRAEVEDASGRVFGASVAPISLAPGAVAQLPVMISVASYGAPSDQEASSCLRFAVSFFDDDTRLTSVPVALRCRRADQSALFAFLDADGSVAVAAVLPPRMPAGPRAMCPVLVSLSGVGVEPQGQADAYKTKGPQEADYTFGFENMWVLAPQRDGPHNWEDRGLQSVFRAIDALVAWTAIGGSSGCAADGDRLVVHGHSRGAHGAWGLASAAPDRVLGVAASCGWYSREEYGDANNLWVHEVSLMHMDKMLLGVLHASVAVNENSLHASNLKAVPALVRVATRDQAVPAWFGRRMARHLREEGANVTFQEFDQEHWWWDTHTPNDGGVMHDPSIRSWTLQVSQRDPGADLARLLDGGSFELSAGGPLYEGRFGLRILQRAASGARGFLRLSRGPEGALRIASSNVQSFALRPNSALARLAAEMAAEILVDDRPLPMDFDPAVGTAFCKRKAEEVEAVCDVKGTCVGAARWGVCDAQASFAWQGPIRQVLTWSTAQKLRSSHRFLHLGLARRLQGQGRGEEQWPVQFTGDNASAFALGGCAFAGAFGAVFRAPVEAGVGMDVVVTALEDQALVDLVSFSFASNQPHTRAPFSNMLPDFLISGPDFRWKGYGGVAAAGFWDENWRVAPFSAYLRC